MTDQFGPWNPGIASSLPARLRPKITLVQPEHVFESIEELDELRGFSGLPLEELATFRPQRLMVHELLIRVSADYVVSDGNDYEDLGINFRAIAQRLLDGYLLPKLGAVDAAYEVCKEEVFALVDQQLGDLFPDKPREGGGSNTGKRSWWQTLFARKPTPQPLPQADPVSTVTGRWSNQMLDQSRSSLERAVDAALARVVGSIVVKHGQLRGDRQLLGRLTAHHALNTWATLQIGDLIQPWVDDGADEEGFRRLPRQKNPVIMNVKGASAAGKSTLRPLQQQLTRRVGLNWSDFALISPDIFRKFLLDYDSLGDDYKYAGTLSGDELQIVDQKLDRYVAGRAATGHIPHLLIDRFRFDSFTPKSPEEGSNLLTRFGAKVFMFFVVTPPHQTVERAWNRGLQVGRYKAVDDLLDHNIEAFNGMPHLFFTWALNADKDVHYEFLDNSVAKGEQPRTIAYGENGRLTILDVDRLCDINRFQKLNVNAAGPEEVYETGRSMSDAQMSRFMQECIARLPQVDFADFETGEIYLRIVGGRRVGDIREKENISSLSPLLRKLVSSLDTFDSTDGMVGALTPADINSNLGAGGDAAV